MKNLAEVIASGELQGNGPFTKKCHDWLENLYGAPALLTHSCTAALDMAMMLVDFTSERNEVILPSFTFVSTATCIVNSGGVPVFVDVDPATCNIDPAQVESAVTDKTAAIVAVHYAGVCADMDALAEICRRHDLILIEDAAQALLSRYKGRHACTLSDMACLSFHETKNLVSGEGGALVVTNPSFIDRARVIRDKGTNRYDFFRPGSTLDKYSWQDKGSSFLPSELIAAVLFQQLGQAERITQRRVELWHWYRDHLSVLEEKGFFRIGKVPPDCETNGHIFYLLCETSSERDDLLEHLKNDGIGAQFHYIPLHSSVGARKFNARTIGDMKHTDSVASRMVRLPSYAHMTLDDSNKVVRAVYSFYES
ncbi:MAG: dTDP-4-amino-4,6-dideoxygalactose transaminase [Pseudomonadales bacterium]|nr:dTDP-4-amino-4,6-dideoxygalactose transaminase [Pseudomonadales bacterium]